jgi:hypothetical protein
MNETQFEDDVMKESTMSKMTKKKLNIFIYSKEPFKKVMWSIKMFLNSRNIGNIGGNGNTIEN